MILVPYEKSEIAEATRRSELDEQMAKVLKRNDLDERAKFRLYQRLLELYLRYKKDKLCIRRYENNAAQTDNPRHTDFAAQTINDVSVQTVNDVGVQAKPSKSTFETQTSFSEDDKNIFGNSLIEPDYSFDNLINNYDYNVDGYRSIYDPRHSNVKDLNLTSYHQLDKSYLNPIKINKKLELDYNEPTPLRPSLLQKSVLDASLINSIRQPITKLDTSHSKIFETPDATKNEISSYSPVDN